MFRYLAGVKQEFAYIRWLSIRRALVLTLAIIAVGFFAGFVLGAIDRGLSEILSAVVL